MGDGIRTDRLRITPTVLRLIAEIDEFKGAWQALGRLAPERLLSLQRVATIESVGASTRIEGAALTNQEVERLLSGMGLRQFATRDEQEVAGYADATEMVFANWREIPLSENHIKQLHGKLLEYSTKDQRHRGEYKTHNNHVEAFGPDGKSLDVVFQTASPFDTPRLMRELVDWTQHQLQKNDWHPLIVIAVFLVVFLAIHPFQDGNGRLSRILTTLLLLRSGYDYAPYSSLESIIEQTKDAYYLSLRQTQDGIWTDSANWKPWLTYFLQSLHKQKAALEKKIQRERLILGDLPKLSQTILELCQEHGRVTVAQIVRLTGANRNTIKDHLRKLTKAKQINQHGAGRGTWYGVV